jgi:hypothetical protein
LPKKSKLPGLHNAGEDLDFYTSKSVKHDNGNSARIARQFRLLEKLLTHTKGVLKVVKHTLISQKNTLCRHKVKPLFAN